MAACLDIRSSIGGSCVGPTKLHKLEFTTQPTKQYNPRYITALTFGLQRLGLSNPLVLKGTYSISIILGKFDMVPVVTFGHEFFYGRIQWRHRFKDYFSLVAVHVSIFLYRNSFLSYKFLGGIKSCKHVNDLKHPSILLKIRMQKSLPYLSFPCFI